MKLLLPLSIAASLAIPALSLAAVTCPNRASGPITAPSAASEKCQLTIAKQGAAYFATKVKTLAGCLLKEPAGTCPTADAQEKLDKAIIKAVAAITKECGADTAQDGLSSSYGDLTDDAVIPSCMLSQDSVTADVLLGQVSGISTAPFEGEPSERANCVKELNKAGVKYALGALKSTAKCIDAQIKDAVAGNLASICLGSWSGGTFTAPTDLKAADALAKLSVKAEASVTNKCGPTPATLPSIFACGGGTSVADFQNCLVCNGFNAVAAATEAHYGEAGTYVTGSIQTAVNAASSGDKLLIAPGTYLEEVTIPTDDLQLVGCGAATNNRPSINKTGIGNIGIFATAHDDLLFQSLRVFDWNNDGIRVVNGNNVAFRDIIADGNRNSDYGVFPIQSDGVLVEDCHVTNVADAGIYVGQSSNITVRFNTVSDNVAGIEIENSLNADVHNNIATHNTAGILVFKLPGLPVQTSNNHTVTHNISASNDEVNFGDKTCNGGGNNGLFCLYTNTSDGSPNCPGGTCVPSGLIGAVPDGIGMFIISNDDSVFEYNLLSNNGSFGLALLDQKVIEVLAGPIFGGNFSRECVAGPNAGAGCSVDSECPSSTCVVEQTANNNDVRFNSFVANGLNPDDSPPNNTPLAASIIHYLVDDANHNNCFMANSVTPPLSTSFITASDCTP